MRKALCFVVLSCGLLFAACSNSPHPEGAEATNTLFTSFDERSPRYLDPTSSYASNETPYTYQIYEPLYGYHYLKRPYELVPKTARSVVSPTFLDKSGQRLPDDAPADQIEESVYEVQVAPGIMFAPHPAFAKDAQGNYLYHQLTREQLGDKRSPWQFAEKGTRELVADDYLYAFKRHASPRINAPVFGVFSAYVVGLAEYGELIRKEDEKLRASVPPASSDRPFLDFRKWPLSGVEVVDKYTLRIRVKGKYPQWKYWMAMTFLAPIPWEAEAFYARPGMTDNGLSLNTWPIGTGPYMMWQSIQDRLHVLKRYPNYRGKPYPCEGAEGDREAGLLSDCGKRMPFIDEIVFNIEKETVPRDAKFRQGYYDAAELDQFTAGVSYRIQMDDSERVKREFEEKGIQLPRTVDLASSYTGFNWLDPVVGAGDTPEQAKKNRKLRQAVSIALDIEEYVRIFPKSAGEVAMGPLPGGVFGSRHGTPGFVNPVTHRWVEGRAVRRSIDEAKHLLAEAGYPDGRDAKTGQPLVLNYDYGSSASPESKALLDWTVKQYAKLGVQLEIRATDYNQFQDKVRRGKHQIFTWGWLADYPDAENFLFLLYGPNAKSTYGGENAANYQNAEYDALFAKLRFLEDGPEKEAAIDRMVTILQEDAPWGWGQFPFASGAFQSWLHNTKPSIMVRDQPGYYRLDTVARAAKLPVWNAPVYFPLGLLLAGCVGLILLARRAFLARERENARGLVRAPDGASALGDKGRAP